MSQDSIRAGHKGRAEKPLMALAYMKHFQCIGPACEDTCCQGWRVHLDADDVALLHALGKKDPSVGEKLQVALEFETPSEMEPKRYARFKWDAEDKCHFLACGSCSLHRDFGEKSIPKACASYPRRLSLYSDRIELSGSLSCPEIARLCLLSPTSCQIEPYPQEKLPFGMQYTQLEQQTGGYYEQNFVAMSQIIQWFLRFEGFPTQELLYFLSYFSKKIEIYFYKGVEENPEQRVGRILDKLTDLQYLKRILETYHSVTEFTPVAANLLFAALMIRWDHEHCHRFNDLVKHALEELEIRLEFDQDGHLVTRSESLFKAWHKLQQRKERLNEAYGTRLEMYWRNYVIHFWHQNPYTESPSLWRHCQKAILYFSLVKLLFYAHPALSALVERQAPAQEAYPILDAAIVEAAQILGRSMTHSKALADKLSEIFAQKEIDRLLEWMVLLKV